MANKIYVHIGETSTANNPIYEKVCGFFRDCMDTGDERRNGKQCLTRGVQFNFKIIAGSEIG